MSIWGKLTGAAAGLAVGGPIGALLGGLAGHFVIDHETAQSSDDDKQVAFTVGVIALGAKMAKADGVVTKDEVHAFKQVFQVPDGEAANVARIFDLAKQDVLGFESYAKQLDGLFHDNRELLKEVLDGLFHIAKADDVIHPGEDAYLSTVAKHFGFSAQEYRSIRARHVKASERDPYEVLNVPYSIGDDALKAHYHKLLMDNHPDKLIARGLPKEFVDVATRKVATINAAYEQIRKERGF
ncbi:MAG: TerB family tellurite resistance protein [Hyphomicrobiales bacterium]|nr:TerB family tellurite resistance protein [Hyphomicrobiales bacterium]